MDTAEIVYLARDNSIDLQLQVDGADVNLTPVTRVLLTDVKCGWSVDSQSSPGVFDWSGTTGKLVIKLGGEAITPGSYSCYLILFDPANPDGVVWGDKIPVKIVSICSAPVL